MTPPPALVARTVDLDPAQRVDLIGAAGTDGVLWLQGDGGLAGRGCALRIELPKGLADPDAGASVAEALEAIDVHDDVQRPGTGPVALGALPFDREAPGYLVVPEVLVGRSREGRQWITTVAPAGDPRLDDLTLPASPAPVDPPDGFSLTSPVSHQAFKQLVRDAVATIERGVLDKVVVAREVVVDTNQPIAVASVLERLHALYPSCTVFSMEGFVGATPELLLDRRGERVRSHPLAGTFPRSGDPEADEIGAARLQQSLKDRSEHRFVIEELDRVLRGRCVELTVPAAPSILPLRNVIHLATEVSGRLDPGRALPSVIDLVADLHPTPAVGGTPTDAALAWLDAHESLCRDRYAGPVGWVDRTGDGTFVVGIRSAELSERRARLFAGVGIVEGSDPDAELTETQLKLQALLAALVRP